MAAQQPFFAYGNNKENRKEGVWKDYGPKRHNGWGKKKSLPHPSRWLHCKVWRFADIFQKQLEHKTQHFSFIILLVGFPLEMLVYYYRSRCYFSLAWGYCCCVVRINVLIRECHCHRHYDFFVHKWEGGNGYTLFFPMLFFFFFTEKLNHLIQATRDIR